MSNVGIGVVGLGRLGKRHAHNLVYATPGASVIAACSIVEDDLAYARHALGIETTYTDYAELLANPAVDAVFLVTPTSVHAEQIIQALEAGKHVFCEKPLAINVADCQRVIDVAKKFPNQISTIGFVRRFDPSYVAARKQIDKGMIGQPIMVRSQTVDMDNSAEFQIPFTATSGGFAHDIVVHDIDLARWYLGAEMSTAYTTGGCYRHKGFEQHNDIDNASALCAFDNGTSAYFFVSRIAQHGHDTRTEIVGTEGTLKIGQTPIANLVEICDKHGVRRECVQDFFERFEDAFRLEAIDFVAAIREGRAPRCGLEDAIAATRGAIAITDSWRSKKLVEL